MEIKQINVFSQTRKGRTFVGVLSRSKGKYYFEYDKNYRRSNNAIPIGPDLNLLQDSFSSSELFPSLADRIPSRENPAYREYCAQWGIDEKEDDPFVLLTTIGRRGPSTFVFEASPDLGSPETIRSFRNDLSLSQREFSKLFAITQNTLSKLESGKTDNATIKLFIKMCSEVPSALKWLLETRAQFIHDDKRVKIDQKIKSFKC